MGKDDGQLGLGYSSRYTFHPRMISPDRFQDEDAILMAMGSLHTLVVTSKRFSSQYRFL